MTNHSTGHPNSGFYDGRTKIKTLQDPIIILITILLLGLDINSQSFKMHGISNVAKTTLL